MKDHPRISADPGVMSGTPCLRGTRITVANVIRQLAAGRSRDEICRDYPDLAVEDIQAALEFAADVSAAESHELAT